VHDGKMLFAPLRIRSTTLPNRLVLPAMVTRLSGEEGFVNDDVRARYVRFAKGGVGLVVLEAMAVHGAKSGPLLRISSDEFVPGLRDLGARIHDAGPSKVAPQIIHFLKVARSGWRQTVDMLSREEIEAIVDAYGRAAVRARDAGMDGVELHMAHAYTLSSFLSRLNPRKDEYGGSLANRLRLPLRVLARVRREVGDDFPVGVRFVGDECVRNGYTVLDAGPIAVALAEGSADWISLSAGGKFEDARVIPGEPPYPYTGYSGDRCMPGAAYPDGANLYIPEAVRAALREAGLETPVIAAGKIADRAMAEQVLARGQGDMVGMARALLADPDLPRKWARGDDEKVVRCLYGNVCKALDENFRRVDCTLWPKRSGQAPESDDAVPPVWPETGPDMHAEYKSGRVLVRWQAATDNEAVYGYQVFRAEGDGGILRHHASVRAASTRYEDARVTVGATYRYAVRPYDLAGNRGPMSPAVLVLVPRDA
jgi:2,4-dienoyl-CoA reductase-like NADH-dependent reductase (Old Yellow Enzyme family)